MINRIKCWLYGHDFDFKLTVELYCIVAPVEKTGSDGKIPAEACGSWI